MDFSRLRQGEIVAAIGGIALFVFMFFDWFGGGAASVEVTEEVPGLGEVPTGVEVEEEGLSAWDALQDFSGFLIALAAVSGIALGALAATGRRVNLGGLPRGCGTAALGSLAVALILWRLLANPGDLEIGIFLGLAAAIAIAAGAVMALREGGFEPLLPVGGAGAPTATMRASAPASSPPAPAAGTRAATTRRKTSRAGGGTSSRSGGGRKTGGRSTAKKGSSTRSKSRGSSTRSKSRSSSGRSSSSRSSATAKRSGGSRRSSGGRSSGGRSSGRKK